MCAMLCYMCTQYSCPIDYIKVLLYGMWYDHWCTQYCVVALWLPEIPPWPLPVSEYWNYGDIAQWARGLQSTYIRVSAGSNPWGSWLLLLLLIICKQGARWFILCVLTEGVQQYLVCLVLSVHLVLARLSSTGRECVHIFLLWLYLHECPSPCTARLLEL